jgi:hypothetical protein
VFLVVQEETVATECFECVQEWPKLDMADSYFSSFEQGCLTCGDKVSWKG